MPSVLTDARLPSMERGSRRTERIGVLAAALAAIGFGSSYPATAIALRSFTPLSSAAVQGSVALVLVCALVATHVVPRPSPTARARSGLWRLALLGLLGGVIFIIGMNVAVALTGPTIAGFVATLYAVFAALFAVPVLGERLRVGTVAAFVVALAGTVLLAGFRPLDAPLGGVLAALTAALAYGVYLVLARRWSGAAGLDGTSVTLANLVGRGPLMLVIAFMHDSGNVIPSNVAPEALVAMAWLIVVPSLLSQLLIMASVRRVAVRRTSASLLLTPLTGALLSAWIVGERLAPVELLGGVLVIIGIAGASGSLEQLWRWASAQLGAAMSRRGNSHQA